MRYASSVIIAVGIAAFWAGLLLILYVIGEAAIHVAALFG